VIASRIAIAPRRTHDLVGGCISLTAVSVQSGLLLSGYFTPLVLSCPPCSTRWHRAFHCHSPIRAMATIPRLAGTAAGIGVFAQNFLAPDSRRSTELLADGSPRPMMVMTAVTADWECSRQSFLIAVTTAMGNGQHHNGPTDASRLVWRVTFAVAAIVVFSPRSPPAAAHPC